MLDHFKWMLALCLAAVMLPGMLYAEEPLKIGVLAPLDASAGKGIRYGAEMAAEEINSRGGIMGKPVQLVFSDDRFKPEIGAYEYSRLVKEDKVAAVIGTASSEVSLAVMEQMAQYKVPFLVTGATSPKITAAVTQTYDRHKYLFRICHSSDEIADLTAGWIEHLVKTRKMKSAALMIESAAWTKPIAETWEKRLRASGADIPVFEYFYKETKDFTPILSKIAGSKADMICVVSAHVDASTYVAQWADIKGPILTGIVAGYSTIWDSSGGKVLSMSGQVTVGIAGLTPKDKPFCETYVRKYNSTPEYTSPYTYDAMYMLKAAIETCKSSEPETLTDALEKTDYDGVTGRWIFNKKSHHPEYGPGYRQTMMAQWHQEGKLCIVWPENLKTCEFILPPWYKTP